MAKGEELGLSSTLLELLVNSYVIRISGQYQSSVDDADQLFTTPIWSNNSSVFSAYLDNSFQSFTAPATLLVESRMVNNWSEW